MKKKYEATIAGVETGIPPQAYTQVTPGKNEARYRTILNNIEDGYYEVDLKGNMTFFNFWIPKAYGYNPDEFLGKNYRDYTDVDNAKILLEAFQEVLKTGRPSKRLECEVIKKDGSRVSHEISISLIRDSSGKPTGFRGIARDISSRKRSDDALRESQQMLQLVLDTIPVRVFWKDSELNYLGCNRQFAVDAGLSSPEEIISKDDFALVWADRAEGYRSDDLEVMETGISKLNYEEQETTPDGGMKWVQTSKIPLLNAQGKVKGILGIYEDITDRKQAEQAIRESREYLNQIINCIGDPVFVKDRDHKLILINNAYASILGKSTQEILEKTDYVLLPKEQVDVFWKQDDLVFETGEENTNEEEINDANSTIRTIITKRTLFTDKSGSKHIVGVIRDITDRKGMEERLRESEKRFRSIFNSVNDALFIHDLKTGEILDVNQRMCELYGYTREEVLRIDVASLSSGEPPYTQTEALELMLKAAAGNPQVFEWKAKDKSGRLFWVEVSIRRATIGEKDQLIVAARDISLRKKAQADLVVSEKKLSTYIQTANDAVITFEGGGKIIFWNAMAERMFGYKAEEMLETDITIIISPRFRDEFSNVIRMSINATKKILPSESTPIGRTAQMMGMRMDGGEFPIEISTSIWESEGKHFCTSIIRDITDRKRMEDSLRREAEELKRARMEREKAYIELQTTQTHVLQQEKMASIGQLAAGVAHEINNPMGFISSNLGTLRKYLEKHSEYITDLEHLVEQVQDKAALEGLKENRKELKIDIISEDIRDLISESLEGAERVKKIVQDLKSFSRVDQAEYKQADINECIESTINIVWNELKYKATVNKEYGDIPHTKCYPQQLNQVFMNLLVNAAQAIEKQGVITVRTWREDGFILVSITDTGCGMEHAIVDHIFEPFYTTKEAGKGTGLGLSITYDIVKKHGGELTVQSEVGKGSVFTVRIPIV